LTEKGNKKAHISNTLAGGEIQALQSANADQHRDRITRFSLLKHRAKLQENFLYSKVEFNQNGQTEKSYKAMKAASKLSGCGQFLLFRNYYTLDQVKLEKFHVCNQHLLCPMCAGIRAARSMNRYIQRIDVLMRQNPRLKPVLLTLTVKNGEDLQERFEHLTRSFRTLLQRYRDFKKKGWGFNQFCKIDGGFYTTEYTYNEKTKQWHPHIHIFALINDWIDQEELAETWHDITHDSYIVDVRRVRKTKEHGYSKAVAEVCKYALKFSDLSLENTWEAFLVLKGKRLTGSFGSMHGIKIPDTATPDEMPKEELPYLAMLYHFVFGKKSYYDLVSTRHVEPQANIDRMSEEEATTDRHDMREIERVAIKDGRGALRAERARIGASAPQHGRKKQHWQLSPVTRVRVRQRIRRWGGYLYNIDLFPYVERRLLAFIEG
jgi:plasmid rolling circle replication initiator protein Rep